MNDSIHQPCGLCQRLTKRGNEHHLIPRTCHSNKWFRKNFARDQMLATVWLCLDCHKAIHLFVPSEKELGRDYNTIEKLLTHPEIARFVQWIRKQK
ncbi:MAG: hypothetical protein ACR2NP_18000 [Pirellulaceae bacterium]